MSPSLAKLEALFARFDAEQATSEDEIDVLTWEAELWEARIRPDATSLYE